MNLEELKKYDSIVIVGSQRSGTQIAARIIASELDKVFVHESEYEVHNLSKMLTFIGNSVIHAPALTHLIQYLDPTPGNIGVVFIGRDFNDIIKSQKRIGWNEEDVEREKYFKEYGISLLDPRPICIIKHDVFFENHNLYLNTHYLNYYDFEQHPMFVSERYRKNFTAWQTEIIPK